MSEILMATSNRENRSRGESVGSEQINSRSIRPIAVSHAEEMTVAVELRHGFLTLDGTKFNSSRPFTN